jgi:hypothetical protein
MEGGEEGKMGPKIIPTRPVLCPQPQAAQKGTLIGTMAKSGPLLETPAASASAW